MMIGVGPHGGRTGPGWGEFGMVQDVPFWFKQRQCKSEPAGDNVLRVSGPNLGEAFLIVRQGDGGRWQAALRLAADGPDMAATEARFPTDEDAWLAAFELYRSQVIV
jgi:hypothetical protein